VISLSPHREEDLLLILERACRASGRKLESLLDEKAIAEVLHWADGDGRRLIGMLEEIVSQGAANPLTPQELAELRLRGPLSYSRTSDDHYNCASALIKSIRGSDPQAALYYLARMIELGEDPKFIARRLTISASEDIGNADPQALLVATAASQAVDQVGLPEAAINLAQAATYLASAPKSNRSYQGWLKAQDTVRRTGRLPVPRFLHSGPKIKVENAKTQDAEITYKNPHALPRGYTGQQFLPDQLKNAVFYEPSERGFEKRIKDFLTWLKGV
jgi:putative ATPase